jgi:3-oxoacyl-[acyl-carrier protein] reductase
MELDLGGRSALITGASKGIGRAISDVLAREGCALHLVSRTAADLERARSEIMAHSNVPVTTQAADLSQAAAIASVVETCPDLDILINNAGDYPEGKSP